MSGVMEHCKNIQFSKNPLLQHSIIPVTRIDALVPAIIKGFTL